MLYWTVPPQFKTRGLKLSVDRWIRRYLVNSKVVVERRPGDRIANLSSNGDRPNPGQCIREIAETFADIRVGV